MIVGIFSPVLNICGGAELVAVNLIETLKANGHQIVVLTDKPLDQKKFEKMFGRRVVVDREIIFPLRFSSHRDYHNIYTDFIRSILLKKKCEILIDTFSNALLPGTNISYIHYPLLKTIEHQLPFKKRSLYYLPYKQYLFSQRKNNYKKLFFANSKYTADAVRSEFGINPYVLYPPVLTNFFDKDEMLLDQKRENRVVTIGRISDDKNLGIIPQIAQLTNKEICFTILGHLDSKKTLDTLRNQITHLKLSDRVKIMTNITRKELRNILLKSKVYLHTKINEHFGISIVEAMSLGCIPVVHNSGGPKEFVQNNFRYENISEASKIVDKAITSWSFKKSAAISKSSKRFNENRFSEQFIDIFNAHFL